jgi:hypothetical protein
MKSGTLWYSGQKFATCGLTAIVGYKNYRQVRGKTLIGIIAGIWVGCLI